MKKRFLQIAALVILFQISFLFGSTVPQSSALYNDYHTKECYLTIGSNTCSNFAYFSGGGSEFSFYHNHSINAYANSVNYTQQVWTKSTIYRGNPYYVYCWVDRPSDSVYVGAGYKGKFVKDYPSLTFGMNLDTNYTGQSTLQIVSDGSSAITDSAITWNMITYPRKN